MNLSLDAKIPGAPNFKWREVLMLRQWAFCAYPTDEEYVNLAIVAGKLQKIRGRIGLPIHITSGLRPAAYNVKIGGASRSKHVKGQALDFVVDGYTSLEGCSMMRTKILPWLEELQIRMEDLPNSNWIHIDIAPPGPSGRFFKP